MDSIVYLFIKFTSKLDLFFVGGWIGGKSVKGFMSYDRIFAKPTDKEITNLYIYKLAWELSIITLHYIKYHYTNLRTFRGSYRVPQSKFEPRGLWVMIGHTNKQTKRLLLYMYLDYGKDQWYFYDIRFEPESGEWEK